MGLAVSTAVMLAGMVSVPEEEPVPSPGQRSRPDIGGPPPPPKGRHPGYECFRCGRKDTGTFLIPPASLRVTRYATVNALGQETSVTLMYECNWHRDEYSQVA